MEKTLETIVGVVERFAGNGRKLGYPTANLNYDTKLPDGVYFGYANLGVLKDKPALIFIGTPTTVGDTVRRVEAFLLDIDDIDYYGENMTLDVRYFHRKTLVVRLQHQQLHLRSHFLPKSILRFQQRTIGAAREFHQKTRFAGSIRAKFLLRGEFAQLP